MTDKRVFVNWVNSSNQKVSIKLEHNEVGGWTIMDVEEGRSKRDTRMIVTIPQDKLVEIYQYLRELFGDI